MDDLLPGAGGNIFCLARIAMMRAIEIHSGKPALIRHSITEKSTTIALKEIALGKISLKTKSKN
jgi:DNA-directed RNA polymerase omega subunit